MRRFALSRGLALAVVLWLPACIVQQHRFDNAEDLYVSSSPPVKAVVSLKMQKVVGGQVIQGMPVDLTPASGAAISYDSEPVHRVFLTGFEISEECVSISTYKLCVDALKCPALPANGLVGPDMAAAFCKWQGMRLPTEAELELAVRGEDGATTLADVSPYGLKRCANGYAGQWVADGYRCDAYVGRAWANPLAQSAIPHLRLFSTPANPSALLASRQQSVKGFDFRCARTIDNSAPPVQPAQAVCSGNCAVTGLALGERFGCALRGNGGVWCWGSNAFGQLGTGDVVDAMPASTAHLVQGNAIASEIAAGSAFACLRTAQGGVSCWGDNRAGQIAGSVLPKESKPFSVASGTVAMAVAGNHGCAVLQGGAVSCWGRGGSEPDGLGPTQLKPTGIVGASALAAGPRSACATTGDQIRCWGMLHNSSGSLEFVAPAVALSLNATASALALGDGHGCAAVGQQVQCWGDRSHWGGAGIAHVPETVATTIGPPRIFATATGTLILDKAATSLNIQTDFPVALASDGLVLGLAASPGAGGCAATASGISCFGVERGQLGRGNGCDSVPATSPLYLP